MNEICKVPQGDPGQEGTAIPVPEKNEPFSTTTVERICAFLSYILSYAYICIYPVYSSSFSVCLAITAALIVTIVELIHAGKKRPAESWIWLGCFAVTVISGVFELGQVWEMWQVLFFVHIFAVWWTLSRSGALLESESGHLLPLDALNGFVLIPFGHFFLRIRTVINAISGLFSPQRNKRHINVWAIAAVLVSVYLFIEAGSLLIEADTGFRDRFTDISEFIARAAEYLADLIDDDIWFRFVLSLPVGCWLFGLMSGSARVSREDLDRDRDLVYTTLEKIRKVPPKIWAAAIGVFSLLYLAFFWLQSSYLFGAFIGELPDGFIVSQYAREGFFELCRVIAVNFTLIWCVTRMSSEDPRNSRTVLVPCLTLLAESMLFAVIAFSKLALYISIYGFTPLRLQSTWLVCVCFAGCVLWMYSLLTGKKTFRVWMIFGAVSLSLLCLF